MAIASSRSQSSCIHVCTSMSGRFDHVLSSVSSCASNVDTPIVLRAQGNTAGGCLLAAQPTPSCDHSPALPAPNSCASSHSLSFMPFPRWLRNMGASQVLLLAPPAPSQPFSHGRTSVAIVPVCGRVCVTATGLRWPLASTELEMGRCFELAHAFVSISRVRQVDIDFQPFLRRHCVLVQRWNGAADIV